jgi:hypothetical protein
MNLNRVRILSLIGLTAIVACLLCGDNLIQSVAALLVGLGALPWWRALGSTALTEAEAERRGEIKALRRVYAMATADSLDHQEEPLTRLPDADEMPDQSLPAV